MRHAASKWLVTHTFVQAWILKESLRVKLAGIAAESAFAIVKLPHRDHDRIAGLQHFGPDDCGHGDFADRYGSKGQTEGLFENCGQAWTVLIHMAVIDSVALEGRLYFCSGRFEKVLVV